MIKQHLYLFIGGAVVGYVMADKLIAYQPWKLTYNLVANL
jgi:hypothetical protein